MNADFTIPPGQEPSASRQQDMQRAAEIAANTFHSFAIALSVSPLGAGWSSDLDIHLADTEGAVITAIEAGWIPLRSLDRHLGNDDAATFAIVEDGAILAKADFKPLPAPDPLEKVVRRLIRIDEPDARSILEFRHLDETGVDLSSVDSGLRARLADAEAAMGGSQFTKWRSRAVPSLEASSSTTKVLTRPTVRLAISGIDGAGKSTLITALVEDFARLSIPCTVIWTRPGMRLRFLERLARFVKRTRGQQGTGLRQLAEDGSSIAISSRRGLTGWVWLTLVTAAYLIDIRKQTRHAQGVIVFDRHLLDALGSLDVLYQGVPAHVQRWMVRAGIPDVSLTWWLDIAPEVATARKPDDLIGAKLVTQQHDAYHRHASQLRNLVTKTTNSNSSTAATDVIAELAARLEQQKPGLRSRTFRLVRRLRS